jgi:hypothetical protein
LLIETINDLDIGWKADTCKYQKHHEKYGAHCEKEHVGLAQVKSKKPFEGPDFEKAHKFALSMQAKYSSADEIPDSELPENFDWRDI